MTEIEPSIDFTRIEFPSDKITVKMIRQAWPDTVDVEREQSWSRAPHRRYVRHSLDAVLGEGVIDPERMLAERAFKVALGQPVKDDLFQSRDELIDSLGSAYLDFGLARGEHEVAALVRRFEAQAEAQARQRSGPTP
ncbi:MAG: hypothetical protein KGM43_15605 [Planctomycetota bacterium]|nr:hypothetical protein [Planctomycetota bacterium]